METENEETVPLTVPQKVGTVAYRYISEGKLTDEKICGALWTVNAFEKLHYMLLQISERSQCDYIPVSPSSMLVLGEYFETIQAVITTYKKCCSPTIAMTDRKAEWELYVQKKLQNNYYNRHRYEDEKERIGVHAQHVMHTLDVLDKIDEAESRDLELVGLKLHHSLLQDHAVMQHVMGTIDEDSGRLGFHDSQIKFLLDTRQLLAHAFTLLLRFLEQCEKDGTLGEFVSAKMPKNGKFMLSKMLPALDDAFYTASDVVKQMAGLCADVAFQTKMAQNFALYEEWCRHFMDSPVFNTQTWECGSANMVEMSTNFTRTYVMDTGVSDRAHLESTSQLSTVLKTALVDLNVSKEALQFATLKIVDPVGYNVLVPSLTSVIITPDEMRAVGTTKDLYYRTLSYMSSASPDLDISFEKQQAALREMEDFAVPLTRSMKSACDVFYAFKALTLRKHAKAVTQATLACTAAATNVVPLVWNEAVQQSFGVKERPDWHIEYIEDILLPIVTSDAFKALLTYIIVDAKLSQYARITCDFSPITYEMMKEEELRDFISVALETETQRVSAALEKIGTLSALDVEAEAEEMEQMQIDNVKIPNVIPSPKTVERFSKQSNKRLFDVSENTPSEFAAAASEFESTGFIPFVTRSTSVNYDRVDFIVPYTADENVSKNCANAFAIISEAELTKRIQDSNALLEESLSHLPDWKGSQSAGSAFYIAPDLNRIYSALRAVTDFPVDRTRSSGMPAIIERILEVCTGRGMFQNFQQGTHTGPKMAGFHQGTWEVFGDRVSNFTTLSDHVFNASQSHSITAMFLYRVLQAIYIAIPYQGAKLIFEQFKKDKVDILKGEAQRSGNWNELDDYFGAKRAEIEANLTGRFIKLNTDTIILKMAHHYQCAVADTNKGAWNPIGIVGTMYRNLSPNQDYDDPLLGGMQCALTDLCTVGTTPWTVEKVTRSMANNLLTDVMNGLDKVVDMFKVPSTKGTESDNTANNGTETPRTRNTTETSGYFIPAEAVRSMVKNFQASNPNDQSLPRLLEQIPLPGCQIALEGSPFTPNSVNAFVKCRVAGTTALEVVEIRDIGIKTNGIDKVPITVLKSYDPNDFVTLEMKLNKIGTASTASASYEAIDLAKAPIKTPNKSGPSDTVSAEPSFFSSPYGAWITNFGIELATTAWRAGRARVAIRDTTYAAKNRDVVDIWKSKYVMKTSVMLLQTFTAYGVANVSDVPSYTLRGRGAKAMQGAVSASKIAARAVYRLAQNQVANAGVLLFSGVFLQGPRLLDSFGLQNLEYVLVQIMIVWTVSAIMSAVSSVLVNAAPKQAPYKSTALAVMSALLFAVVAFATRYRVDTKFFM